MSANIAPSRKVPVLHMNAKLPAAVLSALLSGAGLSVLAIAGCTVHPSPGGIPGGEVTPNPGPVETPPPHGTPGGTESSEAGPTGGESDWTYEAGPTQGGPIEAGTSDVGVPPTCTPDCAGKQCGDDGCGGTCGACSGGVACTPSGTCAECATGQTACIPGNVGSMRVCSGGSWTTTGCGNFAACTNSRCTTVCGGAPPSGSAVCFSPNADGVNDGVICTSNDARLSSACGTSAVVNLGGARSTIFAAPGMTWPYMWLTSGFAELGFQLNGFHNPISSAALEAEVQRAGALSYVTHQYVAFKASSTASAFATAWPPDPSFTWGQYGGEANATFTRDFNYSGGVNFANWATSGDGFGDPPDLLNINWFGLVIQQ